MITNMGNLMNQRWGENKNLRVCNMLSGKKKTNLFKMEQKFLGN